MSTASHENGQGELRVILVGRTGLEAALRLDEHLELVRVGTPIQAIGEASGVAEIGAPDKTVVVLSQQARETLDGPAQVRFASALRIAAPTAKSAALGDADETRFFDAAINSSCSSADLWRLFVEQGQAVETRHDSPESHVQTPPDAEVEALLDRVFDEPSAALSQLAGDEALVARMLSGHNVTSLAVDLLKQRIDDDSLTILTGAQEHEGTPVIWRGNRIATLQADRASAASLSDAASWLAAWFALERQMSQLREEAFTDALTGAWNRRFFDRYIVGSLSRALQDRRSVTLLMFDIDDFKHFNDDYGHAAGDLILRETVRLIKSVIRPTDKVCRMGGDEFVVIFDDPKGQRDPASRHPDSVFDIAHRFQQQIAQQRFPVLGLEAPGTLAVSGGLATFPWDGRTATELLEAADRRTLQSKRQGKNVITIGPGGG